MTQIERKSINKLLGVNLDIPDYQRPYKWDILNIDDLLSDITNAINSADRYGTGFKYRIGTIILHKTKNGVYDIVDGQQRIISLVLLKQCIAPGFECTILEKVFMNKVTQFNIHRNYEFIREWFSLKSNEVRKKFSKAFEDILEVIIIYVDKVSEAFQLFDSQNTRGKALDPHDLLKAYHLREMKKYPYEMEHAVTKWEAKDTDKIRDLFDLYLFPIWNWSRGTKSRPFTAKEIDTYKGITEGSTYTYARRASRARPYFQITEPFIAGNDFFEMVEHYIYLLRDIKSEICNNPKFKDIKIVICGGKDVEMPEDMDKIKFGSAGFGYTNNVAMFSKISFARMHNEISGLQIKVRREPDIPSNEKWNDLYKAIKTINGYGGDE